MVRNDTVNLACGRAVIEMLEHWQQVAAADGITVTFTPVGGWASLYAESVSVTEAIVRPADASSDYIMFSYCITALRDGFQEHDLSRRARTLPLTA